jgi:hypothetical protein
VALLHDATVTPTKLDVLAAWLPSQPWLDGADVSSVESIGSYRFDDPDGEVGVETILLRSADGRLLQVPLTYRSEPLAAAADALITTVEHSVLGTRWVYDGCGDPVYAATLAATVLTGGCEAQLELERDGKREPRTPSIRVAGSGNPAAGRPVVETVTSRHQGATTVITAGDRTLTVRRVLDADFTAGDAQTLTGTWAGNEEPTVLATVRE